MSQNLQGHRPRRFGHNLLTLPLLGFKCTWYEIKSRDINAKGKDFIFYNKLCTPSAGLHGPLHMVQFVTEKWIYMSIIDVKDRLL